MGGRRKTPERAKSANTSMPPRPFTETHAVPRRPRTPERARDAFFRARAPPARATRPRGACGAYARPARHPLPVRTTAGQTPVRTSRPPPRDVDPALPSPRLARCGAPEARAPIHPTMPPPSRRIPTPTTRTRASATTATATTAAPVEAPIRPRRHRRTPRPPPRSRYTPRVLAAPPIDASPTRRRHPLLRLRLAPRGAA